MPDSRAAAPIADPHSLGVRRFEDFHFEITADNVVLREYLADLYEAFPVVDADDAALKIELTVDGDGATHLTMDGSDVGSNQDPGALVGNLVHTLTRRMLDASEALGLHAGGVRREGVGIALPAPMEHGKSTLTAGLVRAGFDYLTDEAVLFDWETTENIPFPKPLSLDPGSWPLFPELEPHLDLPEAGYKETQWQVAPRAFGRDVVGEPGPIHLIVFPRYGEGAETRLVPLSRGEGVVELSRNTFRFNERARRSLDGLAAATCDVALYRLDVGDLDAAVAVVSDLAERG